MVKYSLKTFGYQFPGVEKQKNTLKKSSKILQIFLVCSLFFSIFLTFLLRVLPQYSQPQRIFALAAFGALPISCMLGWFFYRRRVGFPFFQLPKAKLLVLLGTSLFFFIWGSFTFSYQSIPFRTLHQLRIKPDGEKSIVISTLTDLKARKLTEYIDITGKYASTSSGIELQPGSELIFSREYTGGVKLSLLLGPAYGTARIYWDGHSQHVDLRMETEATTNLGLSPSSWGKPALSWALFAVFIRAVEIYLLFSLIFLLTYFLVYKVERVYKPDQKYLAYDWLLYAIPCLLIWSFCLLVFWPALMSYDSIDQWRQIIEGSYNNVHPITHTVLIWLLTRIWFSPAVVAVVQVVALSVTIGWGISTLRRAQTPRVVCLLASILIAVTPLHALFSITIWKDIPFAIFILLLTIICFRCAITRGAWLSRPIHLLALGAVLYFVLSLRHNGLIVSLIIFPFLLLLFKRYWKQVSMTMAAVIILFLFTRFMYFNVLHFDPYTMGEQSVLLPIARYVHSDVTLSSEDQALLHTVSEYWAYDCATMFATVSGDFNYDRYAEKQKEFYQLLFRLLIKDPRPFIEHIYCSSSLLWKAQPLYSVKHVYAGPIFSDIDTIANNQGWLQSRSFFPGVKTWMQKFLEQTMRDENRWLYWRSGLSFLLFGYSAAVFLLRQSNPRLWLVILPVLAFVASSFMVFINQDLRYVYPVILVSSTLWGWAFVKDIPAQDMQLAA